MVSSKNPVVIVSAKRSAIGSFCGSLSSIPAHEIGSQVIKDLIKETAIDASQVDEIILGQVLTAGQGQNPARQAAIMAGFCLLYTSPSPRDRQKSRMPSSA